MTAADLLNKFLRAKFDINDPIYKALIADVSQNPEVTITLPEHFNNGAIAGALEWVRQLSLFLQDQLQLDKASGRYFNLIIENFIGIVKYEGESQTDFVNRIISFILDPKVSEAAIIAATTPYSSPGPPQFLEGSESAFADVSFADNYDSFQNTTVGNEFNYWIMAAIAASGSSFSYFFILRLENTASADIVKVVDIMSRWVASGIDYEIQIVETP